MNVAKLTAYVAKLTSTNAMTPLNVAPEGALITGSSTSTALNVTAATVIKAGQGRIARLIVNTAGSAAGTVSDVATTGGVAAANLIFNIPTTVGIYLVDMPFANGLVVTPGTGQVISLSYI